MLWIEVFDIKENFLIYESYEYLCVHNFLDNKLRIMLENRQIINMLLVNIHSNLINWKKIELCSAIAFSNIYKIAMLIQSKKGILNAKNDISTSIKIKSIYIDL